jgi:hypothetical protein
MDLGIIIMEGDCETFKLQIYCCYKYSHYVFLAVLSALASSLDFNTVLVRSTFKVYGNNGIGMDFICFSKRIDG